MAAPRSTRGGVKAEDVVKCCPWCQYPALKDKACAFVFACGLDQKNKFHAAGENLGAGVVWISKPITMLACVAPHARVAAAVVLRSQDIMMGEVVLDHCC